MRAKFGIRWSVGIALAACGMAGEDDIERLVRAAEQSLQNLRFTEAEMRLTAALDLSASAATRAAILNNLGFVYHESGRYQQAETCYQRAIDAWKQVPGADELKTVLTINNLATHYIETGQFGKLERLGLDSFVPRLSGREPARRDLARLLGNLGALERSKGNYAEAEARLLQVLEIWDSLSPRGVETMEALSNLALVLGQAGRYDDALRCFDRAQRVAAAALPPGDRRMATLLANIAGLHFRARRLDSAESLNHQALAIAESSLGPEHPLVGRILCNYAVVLRARKKRAAAAKLEERGLAILRSSSLSVSGLHTVDVSDLIPRGRSKQ